MTGAYSAQKTELNISLTAIGLLWTTTDFIAKGLMHGIGEEKETGYFTIFDQLDHHFSLVVYSCIKVIYSVFKHYRDF